MSKRLVIWASSLSVLALGTAAWGAEPQAVPAPAAPATNAPAATNGVGPKIQFQTTEHDFGRVKSGEVVKYTYVFTNAGDQVLQLTGVQACGCMTTDWTRTVEPGQTGSVPVSFNTTGYGGPIAKNVIISCNDRANSRPLLQFKGTIWKPVDVNPQFAVLTLTADAPLASATVQLTNNMPEPILVFAPEVDNKAFTAELKTNQLGREYHVVIAPVAPLPPGNARAQINLRTSSTNMPVVSISAFANVLPVVMVMPPQIALPAAPLAQAQTNTLSFIVNSTNAMTLSVPSVNAAGVDVELKEVAPGRNYSATLAFPQGFELPPGQPVELSLRTSSSLIPVLKVPIQQPPRPVAPKVAAVTLPASLVNATNGPTPLPSIEPPR